MRNKTKNMIGIIGAMDEEVASLISKVEEAKKTTVAGMEFCEGMLDGTEVVIVKCGIGKVNAGTCAQILINDFGADKIINTGVAGSLDAEIDIGDIVVSTDAVQHDFDITPIGFAPGQLDGFDSSSLPADEKNALRRSMCSRDVYVPVISSFPLQSRKRPSFPNSEAFAVRWKAERSLRSAVRIRYLL